MDRVPGTVTIAPEVLVTIAQLTTQDAQGVHEMSPAWTREVNRFFGNEHVGDGVQIKVEDGEVIVDLYIIVDHDVNMLQLGRKLQFEVTRAIEEMVGMDVRTVNVHIEDVCYAPEEG
ncbi:MAG TPA: Asp23/Gls24 family envelope stress response protein [Anaerolineae bacterium]|nr:Asp23/Gls24 family envelope stress response protein [Anaerolineae bacterium]